ncbi:AAA family ATPase [Paractinoplanes maris]|uniref:AAA family ATPase n=1 Tax=Paractinoplanes maris TaxID=1734446 RepID=UPI002022982E|nr:AAA family ATPase [Actinoplanes maris]
MSDSPLIDSLTAAVEARPDDLTLRLHLAELLVGAGRGPEAVGHAAQVLAREPGNATAQKLMTAALGGPATPPPAAEGVDWAAMEQDLGNIVPPRFSHEPEPVKGHEDRTFDVERSTITLADVGGMQEVKKRLEVSFLGPLKNPKLRTLFGKSLRGGLLLYGPPGCGKTFLARAVAGEMGAAFISLSITDVLNMWVGSSERNLHDLFDSARGHAPCVLFLDEIDALGHKRSQLNSSSMRTVVNQLLTELDGVDGNNDGVFVLAATNAPWDIDSALRRPGRLDRTLLVLPPDKPARAAILEYHLRDRPVAGVDLGRVADVTENYSGADLAHVCETAAEFAMRDSIASGEIRMINQQDVLNAVREIRPSTDGWFATARNVAMFANESGEYDELAAYLKKRKR